MGRRRQASPTTCRVTLSASSSVPRVEVLPHSPVSATVQLNPSKLARGYLQSEKHQSSRADYTLPSNSVAPPTDARSSSRRVPGGGRDGTIVQAIKSRAGKNNTNEREGGSLGRRQLNIGIGARALGKKERFCAWPPTSTWGVFLRGAGAGADKKGVLCQVRWVEAIVTVGGGGMGRWAVVLVVSRRCVTPVCSVPGENLGGEGDGRSRSVVVVDRGTTVMRNSSASTVTGDGRTMAWWNFTSFVGRLVWFGW